MTKGDDMRSLQKKWLIEGLLLLSLTVALPGIPGVQAQPKPTNDDDPARWSQEDTTDRKSVV